MTDAVELCKLSFSSLGQIHIFFNEINVFEYLFVDFDSAHRYVENEYKIKSEYTLMQLLIINRC